MYLVIYIYKGYSLIFLVPKVSLVRFEPGTLYTLKSLSLPNQATLPLQIFYTFRFVEFLPNRGFRRAALLTES